MNQNECIIDVIRTDSAAVVYAHTTTTDGAVVETATRVAAPYKDADINNILEGLIYMHVNVFHHQRLVMSQSVENMLFQTAKVYLESIPVSLVVMNNREFSDLRLEKKIGPYSPNIIAKIGGDHDNH